MKPFAGVLVLAGSLLSACTYQVPLAYAPTTQFTYHSHPVIGQVTTIDQRDESDPTWIGAIRGDFGNPLKVLHTPRPLADMVTLAFKDALSSRGLLATDGSGQMDLAVTIREFNSIQVVRREATVAMVVELRDHASGHMFYRGEASANPVQGSVFTLDVGGFASPADLQAVTQRAMNQTIDAALDKAAFNAALQSSVPDS